jgi:hypothetical protein
MRNPFSDSRRVWLVVGLLAGLAIANFWPHEQAYAVATDRDAQFALCTLQVSIIDPIEGVFVLDFLTGSLKGAVINRTTGMFTAYYFRNLAADFGIDPKLEPHYAMVGGQAQLPAAGGGLTPASSLIYIGELTSGKVIAYAFPWRESPAPNPPIPVEPVANFQFRQPSK